MSDALTVSVVIVSRHRPDALRRAILGVVQQSYHPLELVIVADHRTCMSLRAVPQAVQAKVIPFDEANISAARNIGINAAAGEIIAFVDDDAVPEPSWLRHLTDPFSDPEVMVSGGFVRGRNGISWQSRGQMVDDKGQTQPLRLEDQQTAVFEPAPGLAVKTEGTNMAMRRSALVALGGFDPRYHFFLDETDLNLRVSAQGWVTALVPLAQVHHGFAASDRRRQDRVPKSLYEIGASWAVFLAQHCSEDQIQSVWAGVCQSERNRLLRHMVSGALEPRDVGRKMAGLFEGYAKGAERVFALPEIKQIPDAPFAAIAEFPNPGMNVLSGRPWSRKRLQDQAERMVASGHRASVFLFSPTALYHRVRFTESGVWLQTGGLFGRSERTQTLFRLTSFRKRIAQELDRLTPVREFL